MIRVPLLHTPGEEKKFVEVDENKLPSDSAPIIAFLTRE